MSNNNQKWPYLLAFLAGIGLQFTAGIEYFPGPQLIISFLIGGLFGFVWPKISWKWGLWIMGPVLSLLCFSVLFAGNLEIFLEKDLPVSGISFISACLGSFVFSRWKARRSNEVNRETKEE